MEVLIQNFSYITLPMLVMWAIGGVLIYLAIAKQMEPTLLLPMGFGAIYSFFDSLSKMDSHGLYLYRFLTGMSYPYMI